jgi:ribonucleoside-diphosphate reductase alpha chain
MATKVDQKIVDYITQDQNNDQAKDLDLYYGDDDLAKDVIRNKYFAPWEESPFDVWVRLALGAAEAEEESVRLEWARKFYNILYDFTFIPGGRIIAGLGRLDLPHVSFSNCYVVPIKEDSLDAIYECLKESAKVYKVGGGVGVDLSILRPKDDIIKGTGGKSCGTIGFMNLYSISTNTVAQNNRRGALMLSLDVSHPDIEYFINVKNDAKEAVKALQELAKKYPQESAALKVIKDQIEANRKVQYANISVKITDDFMYAVESGSDYDLTWGGQVYRTVNAKELFDKIAKSAHESAEPGIIFIDRMRETNNLEPTDVYSVLTTNPCGEIPLPAYGSCLLGSNNLMKFIKYKNDEPMFDFDKFDYVSRIGTRFLDNIITVGDGRHALKQQNEVALNARRLGYGATALADALVMLKVKYGSLESLVMVNSIFESFRNSVYDASCDLALEKGAFPAYDKEIYKEAPFINTLPQCLQDKIQKYGLRGCNLLTIAPNGSLSILVGSSGGLEPIFRISYKRKVKNSDGFTYTTYTIYHPLIKKLFPDGEVPSYVVDSSQIDPENRVMVQATIQKYIDNSISSTVNLPKTATVEDVFKIYCKAFKEGLKGITVYVYGSREGILISNEESSQSAVSPIRDNRNAIKRPKVLQSETHKRKIDLNGEIPYNCYITIGFEPGSRRPYEILINETSSGKDLKALMQIETTSRLISLCLRHNVPVEYVVQQLLKVQGSYIYALPATCANILQQYIEDEDDSNGFLECPDCGGKMKRDGICNLCIDCGFSKCS